MFCTDKLEGKKTKGRIIGLLTRLYFSTKHRCNQNVMNSLTSLRLIHGEGVIMTAMTITHTKASTGNATGMANGIRYNYITFAHKFTYVCTSPANRAAGKA